MGQLNNELLKGCHFQFISQELFLIPGLSFLSQGIKQVGCFTFKL